MGLGGHRVEHCQAYHHQIRVDRVTYPSAGLIQTMEQPRAKALANKVTYVTYIYIY